VCGGSPGTPTRVVGNWLEERACYQYGPLGHPAECSCPGGCGHYTQIVWRSSTQVGCGVATCGGQEIWTCQYAPAGNMVGDAPY
jgi:pathogenesis-related protein 1